MASQEFHDKLNRNLQHFNSLSQILYVHRTMKTYEIVPPNSIASVNLIGARPVPLPPLKYYATIPTQIGTRSNTTSIDSSPCHNPLQGTPGPPPPLHVNIPTNLRNIPPWFRPPPPIASPHWQWNRSPLTLNQTLQLHPLLIQLP